MKKYALRLIALSIVAVLMFSFVACNDTTDDETTTVEQTTEDTVESTEDVTDDTTDDTDEVETTEAAEETTAE